MLVQILLHMILHNRPSPRISRQVPKRGIKFEPRETQVLKESNELVILPGSGQINPKVTFEKTLTGLIVANNNCL